MKYLIPSILLSSFLASCGGGGGIAPAPSGPVIPATLYDTSYYNFKSYPINTLTYPTSHGDAITYGYGDFNKAGELGVFIAFPNQTPNLSLETVNSNPKYLSDFTFWSINSDKTMTMVSSVKGCINPRKAVVADFNKDGIPDVFVACHGYDAQPFPGEKSKLMLSNSRGSYTMTDVGEIQFGHGASAADINNDGYPDIVMTNGSSVHFYINQRNGTFVRDDTRIVPGNYDLTQYWSVELIDINNDGKVDLLVGGNDFVDGHPTRILYGDGARFGTTSTLIPTVAGAGIVLDFTYIKSTNQLFLGRVFDPTNSTGWYNGWALQAIDLTTGVSNVLVNLASRWIYWFIPSVSNNHVGVSPFNYSTFYY